VLYQLSYSPSATMRQTFGFSHRAGLWRSQSLRLLFSLSEEPAVCAIIPD
jgi:hypothetical protein